MGFFPPQSAKNLGVIAPQNKKCLENWKFLLILSRDFLARRRHLATAPAQCVASDKAAPIISEIGRCSGASFLNLLPCLIFFEVCVSDGS